MICTHLDSLEINDDELDMKTVIIYRVVIELDAFHIWYRPRHSSSTTGYQECGQAHNAKAKSDAGTKAKLSFIIVS